MAEHDRKERLAGVADSAAEEALACTSPSGPALRLSKRRRWMQFSLRVLLALMAAVAVLMSVVGIPLFRFRQQEIAAKRLEKNGAQITSEAAEGLMGWAAGKLFGDKAAMRVTELTWQDRGDGRVKPDELAPLEWLEHLQRLNLAWKAVDDEGVAHLRQCKRLLSLNLDGAKITDRGLGYLTRCGTLRRLKLHGARITDAGLNHLPHFSALENIDLSATNITGENLEPLARLPALEVLDLNDTPLTDSAVSVLCRLHQLRWLGVSRTRLGDGARDALAAALVTTAIDD